MQICTFPQKFSCSFREFMGINFPLTKFIHGVQEFMDLAFKTLALWRRKKKENRKLKTEFLTQGLKWN